jgi:transcriptional regulator with XRE-family HTH domain
VPTASAYIKWIRDALEKDSRLSQAGLARHLGRDRAVVSNILTGKRAIKARELEQIAAYLGHPPPGVSSQFVPLAVAVREVKVMGRVSRNSDWSDVNSFHPQGRVDIPGIPDERFPIADQVGFEVASALAPLIDNASHVVAVPAKQYRPAPIAGDLFIVSKRQGPLVAHHAARAVRRGDTVVLIKADDTIETGTPDYFVILTMRLRA